MGHSLSPSPRTQRSAAYEQEQGPGDEEHSSTSTHHFQHRERSSHARHTAYRSKRSHPEGSKSSRTTRWHSPSPSRSRSPASRERERSSFPGKHQHQQPTVTTRFSSRRTYDDYSYSPRLMSRSRSRSMSRSLSRSRSRSRLRSRSRSWSRSRSRSRSLSRSRSPNDKVRGSHSYSRSKTKRRRSRSLSRGCSRSRSPVPATQPSHATHMDWTGDGHQEERSRRSHAYHRSRSKPITQPNVRESSHRFASQAGGAGAPAPGGGNAGPSAGRNGRPPPFQWVARPDHRPLTRSRSQSPAHEPAFRFRFILPTSDLITFLIGFQGWRAKEIKFYAGLCRLTFFDSDEYKAPMGELVGSRKAIYDGLQAIAQHIEDETPTFPELMRSSIGDVRSWTKYGDEFVEDCGCTKKEFIASIRERAQQEKRDREQRERDYATLERHQYQHQQQQYTQEQVQFSNQPGSSSQTTQTTSQQKSREWGPYSSSAPAPSSGIPGHGSGASTKDNERECAWSQEVSQPSSRLANSLKQRDVVPRYDEREKENERGNDYESRRRESQKERDEQSFGAPYHGDRNTVPDLQIRIPKMAERFIIGTKGSTIQRIERKCQTRCFLERRHPDGPLLQIWGPPAKTEEVLEYIDDIIVTVVPSWRTGAERQRFGPGWNECADAMFVDPGAGVPLVIPPPMPPSMPLTSPLPPQLQRRKPYNQRYRQFEEAEMFVERERDRDAYSAHSSGYSYSHEPVQYASRHASPVPLSLGSSGTPPAGDEHQGLRGSATHLTTTARSIATEDADSQGDIDRSVRAQPTVEQVIDILGQFDEDQQDAILKILLRNKGAMLASAAKNNKAAAAAATAVQPPPAHSIRAPSPEPEPVRELPPSPQSPPLHVSVTPSLKRKPSVAELEDEPARSIPSPSSPMSEDEVVAAQLGARVFVMPFVFPDALTGRTYVSISPQAKFQNSIVTT